MGTHTVENQPPPRVDLNEFETNRPLVEGVLRHGAGWAAEELSATGQLVGSEQFQTDAVLANTVPPVLNTHDKYGHRIDEVTYHPSYHRILGSAIAAGAHTAAWAHPRPGANVARAATFMLFAQVEPGHACPVSMTHSVVPALAASPDASAEWMPRLYSREYSGELRAGKPSALFGMAMTEKQGGSDVRANMTRAEPVGDGRYLLTGHKWFCSAPMSDAFLVLAQTTAGLSCFVVPRVLGDGSRNPFLIQRLKDKLGNRSNASCEVEFDGTVGFLLGDAGRGVRTILEMVSETRLDCVLGSAAGMRQSVAEALWHVRHRRAFGALLVDQPAMTAVVADLALEAEAATATSLRLAAAHDTGASLEERSFRRLATAVSKYWICKRGPAHAYEALECLGGNGYTEAFPLARRYREQPVMAVWEGSGNVIALDVLRALQREPESFAAFDAEVSLASGASVVFDRFVEGTRSVVSALERTGFADAEGDARALTARLCLGLQASLLLRFAPSAVSEAFVASRLGEERSSLYGELPRGLDLAGILERH